ncbi:MAG: hypothetical protein C4526_01610 [Nitrospiraceae bacterium]|nr:MAG: hypothetical protein C4526_01610 [Nitrospiraceae bacterium]
MKRASCVLLFAAFLVSCSGITLNSANPPADVRTIQDVPFYDDTGRQCGPASLAAVMNYWRSRTGSSSLLSPEKISAEIYSSGARGTLGTDLESYAKKNGFHTMQYSGSVNDLKDNVLKGIPVIILVDYGILFYQRNHFLVVTGYSGDGIMVHSGRENKNISFAALEKIWRKTGNWTLIVKTQD